LDCDHTIWFSIASCNNCTKSNSTYRRLVGSNLKFYLSFRSVTRLYTKSRLINRYYLNPIPKHNASYFHCFLFKLSQISHSLSFQRNGEFSCVSLLIATASKPYLRRSSLSFACWNCKSLPSSQSQLHTVSVSSDSTTFLVSKFTHFIFVLNLNTSCMCFVLLLFICYIDLVKFSIYEVQLMPILATIIHAYVCLIYDHFLFIFERTMKLFELCDLLHYYVFLTVPLLLIVDANQFGCNWTSESEYFVDRHCWYFVWPHIVIFL
jgi:hypothetical protein